MRGVRSGVAKRVFDKYTHCYGNFINLALNDSIKACKHTLEVTHEITKLIKYSMSCNGLKELSVGPHTPKVRVLCPTRWTVLRL